MNETLLHNKGVNSMKKMAKVFLTLLMMVGSRLTPMRSLLSCAKLA